MIQVIRKAAYRHGYLFIAAAWLYTLSFVFTNYFSPSSSTEKIARTLEAHIKKRENRFENLLKDVAAIRVITGNTPSKIRKDLVSYEMGIFTYSIDDKATLHEVYWNTNNLSVKKTDLLRPDGNFGVTYPNGIFELLKRTLKNGNKHYIIAGLVPLYQHYDLNDNKYLKSQFTGFPDISNNYEIAENANAVPVKNSEGKVLFSIHEKINTSADRPGFFSILLRIVAIFLLVIFINAIAAEIVVENGFLRGFIFLLAIIIFLRLLTYNFPFPVDFKNYELFDPLIYGANSLNGSLGDLLINSILFFWIINFIKVNYVRLLSDELSLTAPIRNIIAVFCLCSLPLITFGISGTISSLVVNSQINFDVTDFFSLNIYTFISFIIICFLVFSFFHLSHSLVKLSLQSEFNLYWRLIILATAGLLQLSIQTASVPVQANIFILGWLICYTAILEYRQSDVRFSVLNTSFYIFWCIFLMASATVLVIYQYKKNEQETRISNAEGVALRTDPIVENLLSIAIATFSDQFLSDNFERFYNQYTNKYVKDSIIRSNFSSYQNVYDTRIYTFDKFYRPLYNEDSVKYNVIQSIVENQGKITETQGLYYYENSPARFSYISSTFGYIYERAILQDSVPVGYFVITANPKAYKNDALSPELFKQIVNGSPDLNENYSVAVYVNQHLIKNSGDYSFSDTVPKVKSEYFFLDKDGNNELWYNAGNNKVIIIVRKNNWFIESLTLFAYLFNLFIIITVLLHFGNLLILARFRLNNLKRIFHFNIRTQVQTTIISVSIFSFLIIGFATISFFVARFNKNSRDKLTQEAQVMVNEIEEYIKGLLSYDDSLSITDIGLNTDFQHRIVEIAEMHNIDVNFYDLNGSFQFSSQSYIFSKQILSDKMQPDAFYALHYDHSIQVIQKETIGSFPFLSIYVPVRDDNGKPIAFLNVPYLNSENELNQEISNFLVTLITLNALIFVLAGAVALLVTSRITSSFTLISNKMKDVGLGKMNEEIEWKRSDEIGILVNEYNKMVQKLEASAKALARSEREGAWREMARQVAHEIKNPLTPMKLSIQYLQRAINNNAPNVKDLSQQVANTLIEQIEQLSKIAGDFSQFANIGNVMVEHFDLTEILASLINLFGADNRLNIEWIKEEGSYIINADKTQITRLFTNLIKNAVEASEKYEKINIYIRQSKKENNVRVSIKDEGMGIPENMKQKIFTPNFTTKSSGTGLGLAICKGIVEKANGLIWFTTEEKRGTTFFVYLPLAH